MVEGGRGVAEAVSPRANPRLPGASPEALPEAPADVLSDALPESRPLDSIPRRTAAEGLGWVIREPLDAAICAAQPLESSSLLALSTSSDRAAPTYLEGESLLYFDLETTGWIDRARLAPAVRSIRLISQSYQLVNANQCVERKVLTVPEKNNAWNGKIQKAQPLHNLISIPEVSKEVLQLIELSRRKHLRHLCPNPRHREARP